MTDTGIAHELADRAWEMMIGAGMPPQAAVDWLREASGCEDVPCVKLAMYASAADQIEAKSPDKEWPWRTRQACMNFAKGNDRVMIALIEEMQYWYRKNDREYGENRLIWCDYVECTIAVCRTIASAGESDAA